MCISYKFLNNALLSHYIGDGVFLMFFYHVEHHFVHRKGWQGWGIERNYLPLAVKDVLNEPIDKQRAEKDRNRLVSDEFKHDACATLSKYDV